jgi:hypothetical protein
LLIPARTLSARALETIPAARAVWLCDIGWASSRATRADLLWIAVPGRSTADGIGRCKLTLVAAVLVGVVADCARLELARGRIAAGVATTAIRTATITLLAFFHDAIAALLSTDGSDTLIRAEALRVDTVAAHSCTDIADTAGREVGDALSGGGVHDVFLAGVAGGGTQRAALLSVDGAAVGAGLSGAIVYGAEGVTSLVTSWRPC